MEPLELETGAEFLYRESDNVKIVRRYLEGAGLPSGLDKFEDTIVQNECTEIGVKTFIKRLKNEDRFSYVRRFLNKLLAQPVEFSGSERDFLIKEHALAVSKDHSLSLSVRTKKALSILTPVVDGQKLPPFNYRGEPDAFGQEVFGVAGGIFKRKWDHSGQIEDLNDSFNCYKVGCRGKVENDDGFNAINLAFLHDVLKTVGHNRETEKVNAKTIREEIIAKLSPKGESKEANSWLLCLRGKYARGGIFCLSAETVGNCH